MNDGQTAEIFTFFEPSSSTFSYVVKDPDSHSCAVIDPVLDFDYAAGLISYSSANQIIEFIEAHQLELELLIETHAHADHLSAAPYIQTRLGGKIAIGDKINAVQDVFGELFNEDAQFPRDGSQFDLLFTDGQEYQIGSLKARAIATPGHTPACMVHHIGDAVFVGDTLFMPDAGTARADFPGGDARTLYRSIQKILSLPDQTRMFMCHDYQPNGRELKNETTVLEQKRSNIHVGEGMTEDEFVKMRRARDSTLGMPQLIFPALQTNMRAGHFPRAENNQTVYLKVPISGLMSSSKQ